MSTEIRGKEDTIGFRIDNAIVEGSFATVQDFKLTPMDQIDDVNIVGERLARFNYNHDGFEGSFSLLTTDSKAYQVASSLWQHDQNGDAPPDVAIIVITKFRDGVTPPLTRVCEQVTLKLDTDDNTGRKEFKKTTWSFKCPVVSTL